MDLSGQLLGQLSRAVVEFYKADGTKPGVLVSWLPHDKVYYVAIHRYFDSFGKEKQVVIANQGKDLTATIRGVSKSWLAMAVKPPESELDKLRHVVN